MNRFKLTCRSCADAGDCNGFDRGFGRHFELLVMLINMNFSQINRELADKSLGNQLEKNETESKKI